METEFLTCVKCNRKLFRRRFRLSNVVGENYICEVCDNKKEQALPINTIARECLKCEKTFGAEDKYMRLCNTCKTKTDREDYSLWEL